MDQLRVETLGERLGQLQLLVGLSLVANESAQTHAAGMCVLENALGDVVGGVKRHHLAGHDDVDFLRLVLADRHGEAATHHVAEHVVGDVVDIVVGAVFFEEVDGGDDAASGAADARLRPAGFRALDALVTDLQDILEFEVLDRARLGGEAEHRVLHLGVENETRGIGLGIAADDENLLSEIDESRERVLRRRRLSDAAFAVEGDLAQSRHDPGSFHREGRPKRSPGRSRQRKSPPRGPRVSRIVPSRRRCRYRNHNKAFDVFLRAWRPRHPCVATPTNATRRLSLRGAWRKERALARSRETIALQPTSACAAAASGASMISIPWSAKNLASLRVGASASTTAKCGPLERFMIWRA